MAACSNCCESNQALRCNKLVEVPLMMAIWYLWACSANIWLFSSSFAKIDLRVVLHIPLLFEKSKTNKTCLKVYLHPDYLFNLRTKDWKKCTDDQTRIVVRINLTFYHKEIQVIWCVCYEFYKIQTGDPFILANNLVPWSD